MKTNASFTLSFLKNILLLLKTFVFTPKNICLHSSSLLQFFYFLHLYLFHSLFFQLFYSPRLQSLYHQCDGSITCHIASRTETIHSNIERNHQCLLVIAES